ncbi:MAG: DUF1998 domain-containing protein, partial [Armatimonadetes bacterium]|nr:DUF1998 domain-containing protein [Armatimonadota bacterium]
NGAPRGEKIFVLYNPPVIARELGIRRDAIAEARDLAAEFIRRDVPLIVFARSRTTAELLTTYLREAASNAHRDPAAVQGYRAGYLPGERRAIEQGLREGRIRAVAATNALELGIDIGQLDAAIMVGYPGTIASAWQQAGRAGRRREGSVAILIATSDPLDQYLVNHPEYFFGQSPEEALINPNNLYLLASHVKCAAFELPMGEMEVFGPPTLPALLGHLEEERVVHRAGDRWHYVAERYPAEAVSLRSASTENVVIIDEAVPKPRVIGEVDLASAPSLVHEDAIYLHLGQQYHVHRLDWEQRRAYVRPVSVDYYTQAEIATGISVLEEFGAEWVSAVESAGSAPGQARASEAEWASAVGSSGPAPGEARASEAEWVSAVESSGPAPGKARVAREQPPAALGKAHGEVVVTYRPTIFKKLKLTTHENVGWGKIHLPETTFHTTACWTTVPPALTTGFSQERVQGMLMALSHALLHVSALLVMSDPRDIGRVAEVRSPATGLPTIYLFERMPGGAGFAERLYRAHGDLLRAACDLIAACACTTGCPSCVGPVLEIGATAKADAMRVLEAVIARGVSGKSVHAAPVSPLTLASATPCKGETSAGTTYPASEPSPLAGEE